MHLRCCERAHEEVSAFLDGSLGHDYNWELFQHPAWDAIR